MSEGFADFSASLFLQHAYGQKNPKEFLSFWEDERKSLTERNANGFRAIDVGPLTMGYRSSNSKTGDMLSRLQIPLVGTLVPKETRLKIKPVGFRWNESCQQRSGLFPSPDEIKLSCSCPDWADMCKHVAAVLYGIGARLDRQPELLFRLHKVDEKELIARAGNELPLSKKGPAATKLLSGGEDLSALFGLDMAQHMISNGEPVDRLPSKPKRPHQAIAALEALPSTAVPEKRSGVKQASTTGWRKVSAASRKRMAEALRARWEARKKTVKPQANAQNSVAKQTPPKPSKRGITAAGRKRLSEMAKARWTEKNEKHL